MQRRTLLKRAGGGALRGLSLLQLLLLVCVAALGSVLWAAHGHLHLHMPSSVGLQGQRRSAGSATTQQLRFGATTHQAGPERLDFPLWWHAPFVSESGLGTEALSIVEGLIATRQMAAEGESS